MHDDAVLWIVLLLSFPLFVIAITPVLNPLYRFVGRRFIFSIQSIETARLSLGAPTQLGIYVVNLLLRDSMGLAVNYSYKRITRGIPEVGVYVRGEIELFSLVWLTKIFGWSPRTVYTGNKLLTDSFGVYLPYWFLGVLPFISVSYHLVWGRNLLFDVVGFFGVGGSS